MRSAGSAVLALALVLVPAAASADVWQDRVLPCEPDAAGLLPLTTSSRILYVNDCLPNGCVVRHGSDSSLTDHTTISPQGSTRTMQPYRHGQAHWDQVIACVKETFAPFDIRVVTDDPGPDVPHFEVMAAGTSADLNPQISGAGGIAPFISCNARRDNLLSFVFANQTADIEYLCAAIAHEAGHTYGLSHSLDPLDPMTYMDLGSRKHWQNADQLCGTETPEQCRCFPSTQNSFRYLKDTFGLSPDLGEANMVIVKPKDGAWVKPGFGISAHFDTPLQALEVGMSIDDGTRQPPQGGVLAWNAPSTIAPGSHTITVSGTDFADRTASRTVTVNVMEACGADGTCGEGFVCSAGFCTPGADFDGGYGSSCVGNEDCATGQCASDGSSSVCTSTCDTGNVCPSGFECVVEANICWPLDGGGCSAGRGGSPLAMLALIGGVLVGLRRRRR